MQDIDLFLSLAEIAGVFVGFGALIAVRSGASDAYEIAPVRMVVSSGVVTMIAALAPVTIGRYQLADHDVWVLSSVLTLLSYFGMVAIAIRTPEYRTVLGTFHSRTSDAVENVAGVFVIGGMALALIVVVLGLAPGLDGTLYFTAAVLILLQAAWTLLEVVFWHMRPRSPRLDG